MFQQSILDSLQNMGFGPMGFGQLSNLTPEQISSVFQQEYGLTDQDIPCLLYTSPSPRD